MMCISTLVTCFTLSAVLGTQLSNCEAYVKITDKHITQLL